MTTENRCPGGCGAAGDCACYGSGYTNGKDKAHFEVRTWDGGHADGCGCEPCQTVRAVAHAIMLNGIARVCARAGLSQELTNRAIEWAEGHPMILREYGDDPAAIIITGYTAAVDALGLRQSGAG